jgi:uncharacterized tellurite resistance protein B-like protein
MLKEMSHEDRMRLMRFVCSFAWADLEVQPEERAFVGDLVQRLHLDPHERAQVVEWLQVPPEAEEVDPQDVPAEHRRLFLEAVRQVVGQDGVVSDAEAENFELLEQLLR